MRTKDGRDLSVLEITAENYDVPKGEEMAVHAKIEVKQFDQKTGKRISMPRIQKFGMKEWAGCVHSSLRKQGYDIEILHDPYQWQRENAAKMAEIQASKAKAEQDAKEAEKAAQMAAIKEQAKAELLAELKAAGIIPTDGAKEASEPKKAGRPPKDKE